MVIWSVTFVVELIASILIGVGFLFFHLICNFLKIDSTHFFIPAADVQDLNMLRGWLANTAFCYKSRVFGQTKAFLEHSFLTTLKANKAWQNLTRILDLLFSIFSLSPVIWHF